MTAMAGVGVGQGFPEQPLHQINMHINYTEHFSCRAAAAAGAAANAAATGTAQPTGQQAPCYGLPEMSTSE
jgi:hypothetical protein